MVSSDLKRSAKSERKQPAGTTGFIRRPELGSMFVAVEGMSQASFLDGDSEAKSAVKAPRVAHQRDNLKSEGTWCCFFVVRVTQYTQYYHVIGRYHC